MSNEWFEIAWINFTKAILHGQLVDDNGREVEIERVLSNGEREQLYALNERHEAALRELLRGFAKAEPGT